MTIKTKQKNKIPKLRFPRFDEDWEEKKLGSIGDIVTGTTPPTQNKEYYNGKFSWITPTDINEDKNIYTSAKLLSEEGLKKGRFIPKNSLLITCIASIGKNAILRVDGSCNQQINAVIPNKQNNVDFLYYLLEYKKQILIRFAGAGGMHILNKKDFSDLKFSLPSLPEQQKIAGFLGAVDERIEVLEKKREGLEKYKKGIMQKIFPAKGEKVPQIRFKGDNDKNFPDWEEKRLGDICKITTGKLDANAMARNGKYRFYTCAKEFFKIDNYAFDTEALLISGNGANVGYIHYYKGKFNAYQRTYILDQFSEHIIYIKYFLEMFLKEKINREKKEGNTPYIVLGTLSGMKIKIPIICEQQKIASFLSEIDKKIELVDDQIQKMQEWKRGLMQELFV